MRLEDAGGSREKMISLKIFLKFKINIYKKIESIIGLSGTEDVLVNKTKKSLH